MGHSVLVVPVPSMEPFGRAQARRYDAAYLSDDPGFAHAHITVLGPFVPDPDASVLSAVGEALDGFSGFDYTLGQIATFPDGTIHLRPEPDAPFRALTSALVAAFPAYPPFGGRFGDVDPHLTLDMTVTGATEESLLAELSGLLPVTERAESVSLSWYAAGACRELARWALRA